MSETSALLGVLAVCCLLVAMVQAAEMRPLALAGLACGLALGLLLAGDLASRTSVAELGEWAAHPQRRLDLSAVLLAETLLFGSQAVAMTQGAASIWSRLLGAVPPPSLLLTMFFAQVAVMLSVDGVDYGLLSWCSALGIPVLFVIGAWTLHRMLPDIVMRSGFRLVLHAVQTAAGLWLARPPPLIAADPLAPMGRQAIVVATVVVGLVFLGWALQRRPIRER